jgi:acetyltransferase
VSERGQLERAFAARHIAIIGASEVPGKWGYSVTEKLLGSGYEGTLTLVNPRGGVAFERPLVSLEEARGADLAVVCTPAATVPGIIGDCGPLGIAAAVVVAGGFGELGETDLEQQLREAARDSGVRVIGPNGVGFYSAPSQVNVTGIPGLTSGHVSLVTQSGGIAQQVAHRLDQLQGGFDLLLSLGNKVDVDFADALSVMEMRPATRAALLYLERFDEGERFLDVLDRTTKSVPVICLIAGKSDAGRIAARSHTGSMISRWHRIAGLVTECGVQVVDRLEIGIAAAVGGSRETRRPVSKVFVLCDGGGHSVLLADALEERGVSLVAPDPDLAARLKKILGLNAGSWNPLDLQGSADRDPRIIADLLQEILEEGSYDAVVIGSMFGGYSFFWHQTVDEFETDAARRMVELQRMHQTPVIVQSMYATVRSSALEVLATGGVPFVEWPHEAAEIIAARGVIAQPPLIVEPAPSSAADVGLSAATERVLQELDLAGIPHAIGNVIDRDSLPAEPGSWVLRLDGFAHKARAGAIQVGILSEGLGVAYEALEALAQAAGMEPRIRLAPFFPHDYELVATCWRSASEGDGCVVGAGGSAVEEEADVAVGRLPKGPEDVLALLGRTRIGAILPTECASSFATLVVDLAALFTGRLGDLSELECNPVAVGGFGAAVLDVLPA